MHGGGALRKFATGVGQMTYPSAGDSAPGRGRGPEGRVRGLTVFPLQSVAGLQTAVGRSATFARSFCSTPTPQVKKKIRHLTLFIQDKALVFFCEQFTY